MTAFALHRFHTNPRMSKVVAFGPLVFLSGQTASGSPATSFDEQVREVLDRIDARLAEAGSDRRSLLSATVYLRNMDDFAAMNAAWEQWISPGPAPARCTVEARMASPHLLIEISAIAATSAFIHS
ncbi:RidA family protein [Acidovorax sp. NCPPB 3859]|nr:MULTISPECIES: RidA family protein [unclassified Acidovorax]MDA8453060.1 RidA family protein [Acidovorax sp. GBBC 3297]MDA8462465.1 RidA family protein [Acidovorax sp. GBBC 3333]MDA8467502.1 RidA family protein [Acidovorax sp. GBBC 3332]MDA8472536.1 RidA family protein [Acidovorax sp. GBBC 3299]WCM80347.1 RidA family protein [Acidovorax sp. GBBC 712]